MHGNEKAFCDTLFDTATRSRNDRFNYLELGVAKLGTMFAVHRVLSSMGIPFEVVGMELPSDPFGVSDVVLPAGMRIIWADTRSIVGAGADRAWDVALIDACHCEECTTRDFLAVEEIIAPWGAVIFHDASPACQEWDKQLFHEARPLRVRKAITDLGLLTGDRPGWKLTHDLYSVPNGCAIFRRTL
jgi:hypothetical protein